MVIEYRPTFSRYPVKTVAFNFLFFMSIKIPYRLVFKTYIGQYNFGFQLLRLQEMFTYCLAIIDSSSDFMVISSDGKPTEPDRGIAFQQINRYAYLPGSGEA